MQQLLQRKLLIELLKPFLENNHCSAFLVNRSYLSYYLKYFESDLVSLHVVGS